jgi:hypothetical protein
VLRQLGASPDELRPHPQVRLAVQHPERLRDQLRERVLRRPVARQPQAQQAPRQQRASRRRPQVLQESQR